MQHGFREHATTPRAQRRLVLLTAESVVAMACISGVGCSTCERCVTAERVGAAAPRVPRGLRACPLGPRVPRGAVRVRRAAPAL